MRRAGLLVAAALLFAATSSRAGTPATTANDVCASNANPCNVTSVFDLTSGAVLDFGTRTVNVTGGGQFNFGTRSGRIACGSLTASTSGAFINAAGALSGGGTSSGSVLVLARRACSGPGALPCLDDNECELGPCGLRRCSLRTTRTCTADGDCQLGTCNTLKRCSNLTSVRCTTNADCDYGTCPAQLTCTGRGDTPQNCNTNSDCSFGTCSVGAGSITADGPIAGTSDGPATIVFRAADDVTISRPVNLNGVTLDSDGGTLSIDSRDGSITIANNINAEGGGFSSGGSVELSASEDIFLYDDISVLGGDFDGGSVDISADRDVTIRGSILANSTAGAGYGGEIIVAAGRDLSFNGVSAANKSTIELNGHTSFDNSAGDGGSLELYAEGNLLLDANTRLLGNGSAPDGSGADITPIRMPGIRVTSFFRLPATCPRVALDRGEILDLTPCRPCSCQGRGIRVSSLNPD